MNRRQFLQRGAMATVAVSVAPAAVLSAPMEIVQDASFEVPVVYGTKRAYASFVYDDHFLVEWEHMKSGHIAFMYSTTHILKVIND